MERLHHLAVRALAVPGQALKLPASQRGPIAVLAAALEDRYPLQGQVTVGALVAMSNGLSTRRARPIHMLLGPPVLPDQPEEVAMLAAQAALDSSSSKSGTTKNAPRHNQRETSTDSEICGC